MSFPKKLIWNSLTRNGRFSRLNAMNTFFSTDVRKDQDTFLHSDLIINRAYPSQMRTKPNFSETMAFGRNFSDHMLEIRWSLKKGWSYPLISPLHDFQIHPAAKVFHYAIAMFEGMKAYKSINDEILLFRPDRNLDRLHRTALRSALPAFSVTELLKILCDLVKLDRDWVPHSPGSLYIRPTYIATEPTLGVNYSEQALLYIITGPVGQYYSTGFRPVKLYADPDYCRAFPGGCGGFKMACNYAPTILVGKIAQDMGCQQVLWLFGEDQRITEVGAMNIFMYWTNEEGEEELVTAPLTDGLILPGITRDSVLELARELNKFKVSERYVRMAEVRKAIKEKRMHEMFGTGTACVVSPVAQIVYKNTASGEFENLFIPTMTHKPNIMQRFYEKIINIQYGRIQKPGWTVTLD